MAGPVGDAPEDRSSLRADAAGVPAAGAARSAHPWLWGGGALLASALVPLVLSPGMGAGPLSVLGSWIGMACFSAAMIVFAFGRHGRGSLVARRRGGVVALLVLALCRPVAAVLYAAIPYSDASSGVFGVLGVLDMAIWLGAAIAAGVAIGRARVVAHPWCWAPLAGAVVVSASIALTQAVGIALAGRPEGIEIYAALTAIGQLVIAIVPVVLGLGAIILAIRTDGEDRLRTPVQVYPPAS